MLDRLNSLYQEMLQNYDGGLSNTSTKKFDNIVSSIAGLLNIPENQVYATGSSSRPGNLEVRLSQGVRATVHTTVGLGFIVDDKNNPDNVEKLTNSALATCKKFLGRGKAHYDCIVIFVESRGKLVASGIICHKRTPITDKLITEFKIEKVEEVTSEQSNLINIWHLQQIFYGAPGTGKSNAIKKEVDENNHINHRTTFHPDSDYSSFVGCYKPTMMKKRQTILDYESMVDKLKQYLEEKPVNITRACTLFGHDYHDSIVTMQENGNHTIPDLVADAYKSGTTYDSQVRAGMSVYESLSNEGINSAKIIYSFVPQAFTKAYIDAWNTTEPVFLIIEEINRGNCAQIFGDLFQLLDRKNGISEYPIASDTDLGYFLRKKLANTSRTDIPDNVKCGNLLMLPSNLYIWATMNTSDQSLFPIDSAFKRRWEWKYVPIKDHTEKDWKLCFKVKDEEDKNIKWWDFLKKINKIIYGMTSSADKQLGYFFCHANNEKVITCETFVNKVVFYLWNDVFKDYGFEDSKLFKFRKKEEDKEDSDLTFPDFFDDNGDPIFDVAARFVENVMSWTGEEEKNNDQD